MFGVTPLAVLSGIIKNFKISFTECGNKS